MYKPDTERFKAFWTALQEVWIKLYGSSFPTVALINVSSRLSFIIFNGTKPKIIIGIFIE